MRIINKIKTWYIGKPVPPVILKMGDRSVAMSQSGEQYKRPVLAKFLSVIFVFWLNHWKWIIRTILIMVTIYVSIRTLK